VNTNPKYNEEQLKKLLEGNRGYLPFSDEAIEFLFSNAQPVEPTAKFVDELTDVILAAKERSLVEKEELGTAATFGDYVKRLEERMLSLLGIETLGEFFQNLPRMDILTRIKSDQMDKVEVEDVANIIVTFSIPYNLALYLLERAFKICDLGKRSLLSPSNARVKELLNTSNRYKATMDPMKKLLLKVDEDKKISNSQEQWEAFKKKLEDYLESVGYITKQ
jgi:hypothetical protein